MKEEDLIIGFWRHSNKPENETGDKMMIKINEYLEGKVKSLEAELKGDRFTAGVMLPGRYSFNTDQEEHITVTLGELNIRLPREDWKKFSRGETVIVPPGVSFDLRIDEPVSYICLYQ